MATTMKKGDRIHFTGGKYAGLDGWIRLGEPDPAKMTNVIVELGEGKEKETRVRKGNVGPPPSEPKNRVDAALQQHMEINKALNHVCNLLAKCNLTGHEEELQEVFVQRMEGAFGRQLAEGKKATWYEVDYISDEDDL